MNIKITNLYSPDKKRPKLYSEQVYIYKPKEGDWSYSHHQSITVYNGKFYAIWSNGRKDEDDIGQRVLLSVSEDFFSWSEPKPLVNSQNGKYSNGVLTAAGFHQYGSKLIAYIGYYEYKPENVENGHYKEIGTGHINISLYAVFTEDGETWSEPIDMGIPVVPNHGPQPTSSGRLIISGNISFPYTDDRSGLSGWKMTGIYPEEMKEHIYDDSESFKFVQSKMNWPVGLCEGSFYQTDDKKLHMLLRANGSNSSMLWVTQSVDDGTTWSEPIETNFSDNDTKFHFGRLPSGKFYYVGSPDPMGNRCPLVLSISNDGIVFDQHFIIADKEYTPRIQGLYKGGAYGYPHTLAYDGHLYIICSICKEDVVAFRIPCDTL
jgi:hypothetical protein